MYETQHLYPHDTDSQSQNNRSPNKLYCRSGYSLFNLLNANIEWPDIVGGTALKEIFNQYGPLGVFLPLEELIEKHAPNIQAFYKDKQ